MLVLKVMLLIFCLCFLNFKVMNYLHFCSSKCFMFVSGLKMSSVICLLMLFFCGGVSIFFKLHYFSWNTLNLNKLMKLFLSVMCFLVVSETFFLGLIGWEYLGFMSFLLMLYYSKYDTLHAAKVTLVSSRFGDIGLFVMLCLKLSMLNFGYSCVVFLSLFFIVCTKSAMFPFVSWLLEAMRAPTPVSCLVHSSTLVAAGIWFICLFGYKFKLTCFKILLVLSTTSIIFSGMACLFFFDLKKMVALSTVKKISWCVLYYILGFKVICLFNLLVHGIAKCSLFCVVGDMLLSSGTNQKTSSLYQSVYQNKDSSFLPGILMLLMGGFPFQGVFFMKHFLMSAIFLKPVKIIIFFFMFVCVFFSCAYSIRMYFLMKVMFKGVNSGMQNTFVPLTYFLCLSSLMSFFCTKSIICFKHLKHTLNLLVFFSQALGVFTGYYVSMNSNGIKWPNLKFGQDILVYLSYFFKHVVSKLMKMFSFFRWEVYMVNIKIWNTKTVKMKHSIKLLFFFFLVGVTMLIFLN